MTTAELMSAVNILEFAESCGLEFHFQNGEYWCLSPFKKERTPSFSINEEKQTFYDFSSGKGGNILSLIKELEKCSLSEAVEILKGYAGISDELTNYHSLPSAVKVAKRYKPSTYGIREPGKPQILPDTYMNLYEDKCEDKLTEWKKEGMNDETLERFQVRYDPNQDRLVFPIRNYDGKIVNICGRTLDKDFKEKGIRKYTYYKKWNGDMNVIFGYSDNAEEIAKKKEIILFEGSKSVFIAHTWGYKNCGALLTSHLSEGQFRFLIGLGVRVVFALDEDVDIRKDKNIQRLKRYCDVEYIYNVGKTLSEKMAPVDAGYDIWKKLYERRRKL